MESSEPDWGEWSLGATGQLDTMMDDYKTVEDDQGESKTATQTFMDDDGDNDDLGMLYGASDDDDDDSKGFDRAAITGYSSGGADTESFGEEEDDTKENTGGAGGGMMRKKQTKKQGMATCEFCGRLGVQDAFYSKTKQYCSLACARTAQKQGKLSTPKTGVCGSKKDKLDLKRKHQMAARGAQGGATSFDWSEYLNRTGSEAASVSRFKHCPLSDCWDSIAVGMKVEVRNSDCSLPTTVYWVATVIRLAGYRALLRYEGFGGDARLDFWSNLCVKGVHPVGWCAANGKPLVPPATIQEKYADWKEFLVKRLTGARTLPHGFCERVHSGVHQYAPLPCGTTLEVVDRTCVSSMRVAVVRESICGRLKLVYVDAEFDNDEFWCHACSPLVHPVGWSQLVGHNIRSSANYKTESLNKAAFRSYLPTDGSPDMFVKVKDLAPGSAKFQAGTKLEAIDPLNLCTICVATVMKVLRNNYLMIGIDGSMAADGSDWFCYHSTSPHIFPVGFCDVNNLLLTPPRGYKGVFKWSDYLSETKSVAAPVTLFDREIPKHNFRVGMLLEAVDLMEPRLICVGTVTDVVGRLLRIHFDGWHSSYDQWLDCESPDVYPVGWCEMVGYHLEGPCSAGENSSRPLLMLKKKRTKSQIYRGPRKKRKSKMPGFVGAIKPCALSGLNASRLARLSATEHVADTSATVQMTIDLASDASNTATMPSVETSIVTVQTDDGDSLAKTLPSIVNMLNSPLRCPTAGGGTPGTPAGGALPEPQTWDSLDVCQFLRSNDCGAHCDSFRKRNIDGPRLLQLSKEQIVGLTGMKVGPSLKIHDLIQSLKARVETPTPVTSSPVTLLTTSTQMTTAMST